MRLGCPIDPLATRQTSWGATWQNVACPSEGHTARDSMPACAVVVASNHPAGWHQLRPAADVGGAGSKLSKGNGHEDIFTCVVSQCQGDGYTKASILPFFFNATSRLAKGLKIVFAVDEDQVRKLSQQRSFGLHCPKFTQLTLWHLQETKRLLFSERSSSMPQSPPRLSQVPTRGHRCGGLFESVSLPRLCFVPTRDSVSIFCEDRNLHSMDAREVQNVRALRVHSTIERSEHGSVA